MNNAELLSDTRLFERSRHGFCVLEMRYDSSGAAVDYVFLTTNPTFESHTGLKDAVGRSALELVPNLERFWIDAYDRVARSGEPQVFEQGSLAMGRVFEVEAMRVGDAGERKVALIFSDITQRRTLEESQRETSERNSYRLELADALRVMDDPMAVLRKSAQLLRTKLGVNRVHYGEVDSSGEWLTVKVELNDRLPSTVGKHRLQEFGPLLISELR